MKSNFLLTILILLCISAQAQFHTLKIPQPSNMVSETQRLGVTDISITYSSPSVNNRDVWNDGYTIPKNGQPIPWRAGANMNTTIQFSTDVFIQGKPLSAGIYGFHIIPKENIYTLFFAHNSNQWGSYYLDLENDVSLTIDVKASECEFSEKLDYEFLDWKENSVTIGLEWAEVRIPFEVSVDLNKTVTASFRSELRGINTYHWQAWLDAAQWCYNHNTNLEEALEWANRSINGGYGGFAANKNVSNLSTKARLLKSLNRTDELETILSEIASMSLNPQETNDFSTMLLRMGKYDMAVSSCSKSIKSNPEVFYLWITRGVNNHYLGNSSKAIKDIQKSITLAPEYYKKRLNEVIQEMEDGNYKWPYM